MSVTGHTLYKKILNTFKCWNTVPLFFIVLFLSVFVRNYFCSLTTTTWLCRCWIASYCMFYLILMSISAFQISHIPQTAATACLWKFGVILIGNLKINDRRSNNHLTNASLLLRLANDKCRYNGYGLCIVAFCSLFCPLPIYKVNSLGPEVKLSNCTSSIIQWKFKYPNLTWCA